jgi:hypothetical protein
MGDSQSQKAGEGALQIQAQGNVTITYGVSYAELDMRIAEARREIAQEVLSKAQEILKDAGIQPGPVPLKTVVPLLQHASLEEDPALREKWAALLASAATGGVPPSFPDVLRHLPSSDARFLDAIFERFCQLCAVTPTASWTGTVDLGTYADLKAIWNRLGFSRHYRAVSSTAGVMLDTGETDALVSLENLCRLQLIIRRSVQRKPEVEVATSQADYVFSPADHYALTAFGFQFVTACKGPRSTSI